MIKKTYIIIALTLFPFFSYAEEAPRTFSDLLLIGTTITQMATQIGVAMAFVVFFWGLVVFIYRADNESERAKGKQVMLWGIIALFVMMTLWGIVVFLQGEFEFGGQGGSTGVLPLLPE